MPASKTDPMNMTADVMKDATQKVEAFAADTQKAMATQMEKLTRGLETATAYGQETVEAMMKSTEIATKAMEGLNAEMVDFSKKSFETGVAAAKDFASAKNMTELFEKQADYARVSLDGFMKQATKLNEMYLAAAKSAAEPLNARLTAATEVMKSFTA